MVSSKQLLKRVSVASTLAAMALTVPASHAIVYQLNKTQAFGTNWFKADDWNDLTTPAFPSAVAPGAGDTASTLNFGLRTNDSGNSTFAAILNINPGGSVGLKTTGIATITDGRLLGGTLSHAIAPNSTGTIGGNLAVNAVSNIALNSVAGDVRTMILAANLSGASNLNVDSGNGATSGTLRLTGSLADYTGAFNLSDTAILDVQGNTSLAIGINNNNGFTASGNGLAKFGVGTETMDISRNTVASSGNKVSTVDVSGTNGVQVNVATLRLGTGTANPNSQAAGIFKLSLAGNNSIIAPTILMGDSPGSGNTTNLSELVLGGGNNIIDTTNFTIAGQKSRATVRFGTPGGVLNLGTAGDRVTNLRLGFNNAAGTGAVSTGILNGTGGTLNVFATNVVLGQHAGGGTGSGVGTVIMQAGIFDVVTMTMGQPSGSETGTAELNTVGTFNLSGGTVKATNINKGLGTANFNMTGGMLIADNFNFSFSQQGGTVAPGGDMILGSTAFSNDYAMNSLSILSIDVANATGLNDLVTVGGSASLDGIIKLVALNGYVPAGDSFDVLIADDILLGSNFGFDTSMFLSRQMRAEIVEGTNGTQILRLAVVVPEPATALLAFGSLSLLALRRRRAMSN